LLCPECAGTEWRTEPVDRGVLDAATEGREVRVGAVRTPLGPLVVARVEGSAPPGSQVALDEENGVPVARTEP
jgi:hypothetical protein